MFSRFSRPMENKVASPQRYIPPDEMLQRIALHEKWLESDGTQGERLVLDHVTVRSLSPDSVRNEMCGRNLSRAKLTSTCLWDSDLTDTNLTDAEGLLPEVLSGTVLTRAKLPPTLGDFTGTLGQIKELSTNAGKLYLSLVVALVFILLSMLKMKDSNLILDTGAVKLPVIDAEVSARLLFLVGPSVLYALFLSTHLYLLRLWRQIATLPAVFPDGITLDRKTYPWLLNDQICANFPRLRERREPLAFTQWVATEIITYWLLPIALLFVWARYLCRHDWYVSQFHVVLITLTVRTSLLYRYMSDITMQRNSDRLNCSVHWWSRENTRYVWSMLALPLCTLCILGIATRSALFLIDETRVAPHNMYAYSKDVASEAARLHNVRYNPRFSDEDIRVSRQDLEQRTPHWLQWFGLNARTLLAGQDLSSKPSDGKPLSDPVVSNPILDPSPLQEREQDEHRNVLLASYHAMIGRVVQNPAQLADRDLQLMGADRAFLAAADLAGARLDGAELAGATLTGAEISGAHLWRADLHGSDLRGANLAASESTVTDLCRADLSGADLSGADLSGADLTGASLKGAMLEQTHWAGTKAIGTDLRNTRLWGADLRGAILRQADLQGADLTFVKYDNHTQWPNGFVDRIEKQYQLASANDGFSFVTVLLPKEWDGNPKTISPIMLGFPVSEKFTNTPVPPDALP